MKRQGPFMIFLILVTFILPGAVFGQSSGWKHRDVWLKNALGDNITPQRNTIDPFSPRMTCGVCHSYSTITSGYHFQQGFDEMSDAYDPKKPWILSPGQFGKGCSPASYAGRVARKVNAASNQIDLSTYDWIGAGGKLSPVKGVISAACGWTHPGGGPLEYGRRPDGKPDLSRNLIEAEKNNKNSLDGDFSSAASPDKKSHFGASGVIEADCLICHMPAYRMDLRNQQISFRNYRWAATAGAGLGVVKGSIFTYKNADAGPEAPDFTAGTWNFEKRPVVQYAWDNGNLFLPDGRLRGNVIRKSVGLKNCLNCHQYSNSRKAGTIYTPESDAHIKAGLQCTDCHGLVGKTPAERLRHQIAKGWAPENTVRNDLDGTGMKTCVACHLDGQYKPTRAGMPKEARNPARAHEEKFKKGSFHFYFMSCNACHSTAQPAKGGYLADLGTVGVTWYTADALETTFSAADLAKMASAPWSPWVARAEMRKGRTEQYVACVPKVTQWFGERLDSKEVRPISLRYVRQAFQGIKGVTKVRVKAIDGKTVERPTIATPQDIRLMIGALTNIGFRNVVFVSDQVYELKKGELAATPDPKTTKAAVYSVHHNVVPLRAGKTLGAKGCTDCHEESAAFFTKKRIRNVGKFLKEDYPSPREPNAEPQMSEWGLRSIPAYE